jgi:hypothetical protein
MLHSVGEYELGLIERYREARARMTPSRPAAPVRAIPAPEPTPEPEPVPESHPRAPMVPAGNPPRWLLVLNQVAEKHRVTRADIIGKRRSRHIVQARHEAMFRLVTECGMSLPRAAKRLGDRDHTTAINSMRKYLLHHPEDRLVFERWKEKRITDEAAKDELILKLFREGKAVSAIYKQVGLSYSRIVRVVRQAGDFPPLSTVVTESRGLEVRDVGNFGGCPSRPANQASS